MKRFMVLVLCLALAFTAVSAQAVSLAKVVGRWYFISVDGAGLAGDSYVEFNRDKTVALIVAGQARDMAGLRVALLNRPFKKLRNSSNRAFGTCSLTSTSYSSIRIMKVSPMTE